MLKSFRIQVLVRLLVLTGTLAVLLYLLFQPGLPKFATLFGLGLLLCFEVYSLLRYVESTDRELVRFFDSIRHADFSQSFTPSVKSASYNELSKRFMEVMEAFRQTRSATEEHLRYVDTVVQHVGIGLISFAQDGEVELINNAAKRLLNISQLKNIHSLRSFSEPLADALTGMTSGENALVNVHVQGSSMQLALHAMEFRMKERSYTLISLQNIQGELERERMSKELEIARELQHRLLPAGGLQSDAYDIAGVCIPSKEVGGDYFDYIQLDGGRVGILVGDVSGKGVPAAIYMTLTKGITQACARQSNSPKQVLSKINKLIYGSLDRGSFITMAYGVLEPDGKPSILARAGHNPVVYYSSATASISIIESSGIALGMKDEQTFSGTITEQDVLLKSGDLLVFYTDGVTELMDSTKEEYGFDRLCSTVRAHASLSAQEVVSAICNDVQLFAGEGFNRDDMTVVVVKKK